MKQNILLLALLLLCCCNAKTTKQPGPSQANIFQAFIKKFKPVELPYIFRYTYDSETDLDKLPQVDPKSSDTLFLRLDNIEGCVCFGMLKDTSAFYSLIYFVPADTYYPHLVTYTQEGNIISEESLLVNGCGADCGLTYCSENGIINKDFSIFCADTVRYDYFCDSLGEPMKGNGKTYISIKTGKLAADGKILMQKEQKHETDNTPPTITNP